MHFRREYAVIFLIMVTEVLGFSLVLPFLPLFAQELGASPLVVGLIFASFSLFQFFSAPIMGRLSDSYGRRPMIMLSQFSTFLGFMVLGFADTLALIFASRIIDGLLGSNFTIAQAYMSDISSKKERSKAFGLAGAAFGVGFLIGPALGGYLSEFSYSIPSFVAAALSLSTILMTYLLLPETVKRRKVARIGWDVFGLSQFRSYLADAAISSRLATFFTFILAHMIFISMLALFAQKRLGIGPAGIGFFLTYVGLNAIILRGWLLPKLIDLCGERRLQYISLMCMIIGLTATAFITDFWMLFITMTLFSFGAGTARPLLMGAISRQVPEHEQGAVLGISNSLGSLAQITGPLLGGFLISYAFPGSMALAAAMVMGIGFLILVRRDGWEMPPCDKAGV
jgi:DHA1 family tetracycline resistance protein-like MFS transporter